MKFKIISILLVLILPAMLLTGCGGGGETRHYNVTVTGHVQDFLTGSSISGAYIWVDSELKDTTNFWGNFQFDYLTTDSFTVIINKEDYIEASVRIIPPSDDETVYIRLMHENEFSGSISGNVMLLGTADNSNPYDGVKVMATYKEVGTDSITYTIFSDIVEVGQKGYYNIEHAKINKELTVIGFEDYNNNNIIDPDELFGEHDGAGDDPIVLNENDHIDGVDIIMTDRLSSQSTENKEIIFKTASKGE